jgi:hypothetical protein
LGVAGIYDEFHCHRRPAGHLRRTGQKREVPPKSEREDLGLRRRRILIGLLEDDHSFVVRIGLAGGQSRAKALKTRQLPASNL